MEVRGDRSWHAGGRNLSRISWRRRAMKKSTLHRQTQHDPDLDFIRRERRLEAIRSQALQTGKVEDIGIMPAGSPIPVASPATGYYSIPMLKEPQWSWEIPVYFFVGGAAGA